MANEPQALKESVHALRELIIKVSEIGREAGKLELQLKATATATEASFFPTPLKQMARVAHIRVNFLAPARNATSGEQSFPQTDVVLLYGRLWVEWEGATWVLEATDDPVFWNATETPLPELTGPWKRRGIIAAPEVRTGFRIRYYTPNETGQIVRKHRFVNSCPIDRKVTNGKRELFYEDGHTLTGEHILDDGDTYWLARPPTPAMSDHLVTIRVRGFTSRVMQVPMQRIEYRVQDGGQAEFFIDHESERYKLTRYNVPYGDERVEYCFTPHLIHPKYRPSLLLQSQNIAGITNDEKLVTVNTSELQEEEMVGHGRKRCTYRDGEGKEYRVELRREVGEDVVHPAVRLVPVEAADWGEGEENDSEREVIAIFRTLDHSGVTLQDQYAPLGDVECDDDPDNTEYVELDGESYVLTDRKSASGLWIAVRTIPSLPGAHPTT